MAESERRTGIGVGLKTATIVARRADPTGLLRRLLRLGLGRLWRRRHVDALDRDQPSAAETIEPGRRAARHRHGGDALLAFGADVDALRCAGALHHLAFGHRRARPRFAMLGSGPWPASASLLASGKFGAEPSVVCATAGSIAAQRPSEVTRSFCVTARRHRRLRTGKLRPIRRREHVRQFSARIERSPASHRRTDRTTAADNKAALVGYVSER